MLMELYEQRKAFTEFTMITSVEVFRCSSAVYESTFSYLIRRQNLRRHSIKYNRLSNLILLTYLLF